MTTARETLREQFEDTLTRLNALSQYGLSVDGPSPEIFPGLNSTAYRIMSDPEIGREIVRSWALVFADTIRLLNRFRDVDLVERADLPERELLQVQETAKRALGALSTRLNELAQSVSR